MMANLAYGTRATAGKRRATVIPSPEIERVSPPSRSELRSTAAALEGMHPISLWETSQTAALMDRTDTRYLLPAAQLPDVLERCAESYRVVEADGIRVPGYDTLYFDTDDLHFYRQHHTGRLSRHKVRLRSYVDTGTHFLEVKRKDNHRRTLKVRVPVDASDPAAVARLDDAAFDDVRPDVPADRLHPVLRVGYRRITLVRRDIPERVTLDLMLHFRHREALVAFPTLVVAEVKRERSTPSPFISLLRELGIRQGGMSKYCLGVASLVDGVPSNRFRPAMRMMARTG